MLFLNLLQRQDRDDLTREEIYAILEPKVETLIVAMIHFNLSSDHQPHHFQIYMETEMKHDEKEIVNWLRDIMAGEPVELSEKNRHWADEPEIYIDPATGDKRAYTISECTKVDELLQSKGDLGFMNLFHEK